MRGYNLQISADKLYVTLTYRKAEIMSLSIDEYALLNGLTGVNGLTQPGAQNVSSAENEKKATDGDSYISSLSQMNEGVALPSDNYK